MPLKAPYGRTGVPAVLRRPGPEMTGARPGVTLAHSRAPDGRTARRWGPPYPNRGTTAANGPYLRSGGISLPGE